MNQNMMRWDVINRIVRQHGHDYYLELGIWMGECISEVDTAVRHGVDPGIKPRQVKDCVGKWSPVASQLRRNPKQYFGPDVLPRAADKFFKMTSDEFFADLVSAISKPTKPDFMRPGYYDFIFIDGDHTQVQSLADFLNSWRWIGIDGTIMLHDTLPGAQSKAKLDGMDNGEVWKTAVILQCTRPDLELLTVDVDEGCTLVSRVGHREVYREAPLSECLTWAYFERHKKRTLKSCELG